jgi:hypothetical protein
MSEHFEQLLVRAEATLAKLHTARDRVTAIALDFGDDIGEIGRAWTLHPELASEVRGFVERTAPIVRIDTGLTSWIHRVYDAAQSRSSDTEDHRRALKMRSDLEFLKDLYRDSVAGHRVAEIETAETDQNLQEWGTEQPLDEIPPGFPPSHVWWHQSRSGK